MSDPEVSMCLASGGLERGGFSPVTKAAFEPVVNQVREGEAAYILTGGSAYDSAKVVQVLQAEGNVRFAQVDNKLIFVEQLCFGIKDRQESMLKIRQSTPHIIFIMKSIVEKAIVHEKLGIRTSYGTKNIYIYGDVLGCFMEYVPHTEGYAGFEHTGLFTEQGNTIGELGLLFIHLHVRGKLCGGNGIDKTKVLAAYAGKNFIEPEGIIEQDYQGARDILFDLIREMTKQTGCKLTLDDVLATIEQIIRIEFPSPSPSS